MNEEQIKALTKCLTEIVGTLAYQVTIPHQHKVDMLNAVGEFKIAMGIKEVEGNPA